MRIALVFEIIRSELDILAILDRLLIVRVRCGSKSGIDLKKLQAVTVRNIFTFEYA